MNTHLAFLKPGPEPRDQEPLQLDGHLLQRHAGHHLKAGETIGRYLTSTGDEKFELLSATTLGGLNAAPLVGPVVIRRIMYHPANVVSNQD